MYTMANNSFSEYFERFADMASRTEGIKVSFVCMYPEKPQMIDDLGRYGWKVHWIKYDDRRRKRGMLKASLQLLALFRKIRPDIVHSILFDDSVPALTAARLAGVKHRIISKCDTGFHHRYAPTWVKFDKYNNWIASHVITISQENDELVREIEKPAPHKLRLIHSGLDAHGVTHCTDEMKTFVRKKYGLDNYDHMVLKVARMIEWKGFRHLIGAAKRILDRYPKTLFILMGEGEQRPELEQMVRELGIEANVIFGGYVPRPELNGLYHNADVHVHAASLEPFGGVITEAMLNGLPLVTTPSGISKECIEHRKNGFLVQPEAESVARGVLWVLDHPVEARAMGQAGRQTAQNEHTKEVNWKRHLNLYTELCPKANLKLQEEEIHA